MRSTPRCARASWPRAASGTGFPHRFAAPGRYGEVLAASGRVEQALRAWMGQLDRLQEVADALTGAIAHLQETGEASARTADEFAAAEQAQGGFSPILLTVDVWRAMIGEIDQHATRLGPLLGALRASCARTRFQIALAWLHNATVGQFAVELLDEEASSGDGRRAIAQLVQALEEGIGQARATMDDNARLAQRAAADIDLLTRQTEDTASIATPLDTTAVERELEAVLRGLPS